MGILAIVPARGGSKGIKKKNIIDVNGFPLIYYTLNELLKTEGISKIVVSTDDQEIREVVLYYFNPHVDVLIRPEKLSGDLITSEEVIKHVMYGFVCIYDYTMLVQCTSPLTEASDFTRLIRTVEDGNDSAAFYVKCDSFFFGLDDDLLTSSRLPRQMKESKKQEAGNAWIFKTYGFLKNESRLFGKIGLCEIEYPKNLEVDEEIDLEIIKFLLKKGNEK